VQHAAAGATHLTRLRGDVLVESQIKVKKLELRSKVCYQGTSPFVVANESSRALWGDINLWRAFLHKLATATQRAPYGQKHDHAI
jgi:hypothetical protein